ncbi:MAG: adenosylcobinamide-GDP ribazoletransferase [Candidatus Omnitrophica bacterium]|nr:adenosylcobinamide-GDP ribazoletransferase [Candidatus Omnitrophota bacterium]MDD5236746.1 adenosylcobinamide-GDP ribazoletransferase [Candidatus Omnitrophota bacterium]MDD5610261.1 adenosylcobinamide-GDP ribazoletransferase [Candidatus Omnitrophota bacterium]
MTSLLSALQFLTVIPLRIKNMDERKFAQAPAWFPAVGLFIGLILFGLSRVLYALNFYELTAAIVLVVALVLITGGMHLDGLSDTFDAISSGKDKEKFLAIMRDPHSGALGVASVVCALLLKVGLIFSLRPQDKAAALILMCVLSRWSAVGAMSFFPYARQEGKAKVFIQGMTLKTFLIASASAVIFALVLGWLTGTIALLVVGGFTYLSAKFFSRKIGGMTGDTLGATIELTEIITLSTFCIAGGIIYG